MAKKTEITNAVVERDAARLRLKTCEQRIAEIDARMEELRRQYRAELRSTGFGRSPDAEKLGAMKMEEQVLTDEREALMGGSLDEARGEYKAATTKLSAAVSRSLEPEKRKVQERLKQLADEFLAIVDDFEEARESAYRAVEVKGHGTPTLDHGEFVALRRWATDGVSLRVSGILRQAARGR